MKFLILSIIFIFSFPAQAFPLKVGQAIEAPMRALPDSDEAYDFNGIVAMQNCSASLVHFPGQPTSDKAYVLTNGHCTGGFFGGMPGPDEVIYNKRDRRSMNAFVNLNNRVRVRSEMLVYGTMKGTDAALFRLSETYDQLARQGVNSLEMTTEMPESSLDIEIISGYWKRGFTCQIEDFVHELHEGGYVMWDSIRYSPTGCEVYGGTSGSPIIRKGERVVVGVNNTGNESGQQCTINNPCEVDENGDVQILEGRGYGQQVYWFSTCLDDEYDIDLDVEGCLLPKP
jgi:hypothetical protein